MYFDSTNILLHLHLRQCYLRADKKYPLLPSTNSCDMGAAMFDLFYRYVNKPPLGIFREGLKMSTKARCPSAGKVDHILKALFCRFGRHGDR